MSRRRLIAAISALAMLWAALSAGCASAQFSERGGYSLIGMSLARAVWNDTTGRAARDGTVSASAGYAWPVVDAGGLWSFDAGASAGSVVDSKLFKGESKYIGIFAGFDYGEVVTIAATPHWITSQRADSLRSYGLGFQVTTRFSNLIKAAQGVADWFGDGVQTGINEAFTEDPAP